MMGQKLVFTCSHMFVHALVLFEPSLSPFFEPFPLEFEFPGFDRFPKF